MFCVFTPLVYAPNCLFELITTACTYFSEHEILREQIMSLEAVKDKLKVRMQELEDELKKVKEEAAEANAKLTKSDDEVSIHFFVFLSLFLV